MEQKANMSMKKHMAVLLLALNLVPFAWTHAADFIVTTDPGVIGDPKTYTLTFTPAPSTTYDIQFNPVPCVGGTKCNTISVSIYDVRGAVTYQTGVPTTNQYSKSILTFRNDPNNPLSRVEIRSAR